MSDCKSKLIQHAKIDWSDQFEPFSSTFEDVYFNTEQGLSESLYVFIEGNDLPSRWNTCQCSFFSIAETGFGTGLNFLITCLKFTKFTKDNPQSPLKRLYFTSFEMYPLTRQDLQQALKKWPSLEQFIEPLIEQYPLALSGCHRITLDSFNITLDLWFGDVCDTLPQLYCYPSGLFDCWFLDGFAPSKNPEMWSEQLFMEIAQTCKNNATIATFTAAGFVRRGLLAAGFKMQKRKGYGKKREMLVGQYTKAEPAQMIHGQHHRASAQTKQKNVAIIGGGISSACLALALIKRGYAVTLYCKDETLASGASSNQQGALYPLLNNQHDALSQFFANSFLYTRNYVEQINHSDPFDFDLSGLLQLYYDNTSSNKLNKIVAGNFPKTLLYKTTASQTNDIADIEIDQDALFYPLAGWLNPQQMVMAIFNKAKNMGDLTVHCQHDLHSFTQSMTSCQLYFEHKQAEHDLLILASGIATLDFSQCKAIPLSAARGQVTHIPTTDTLERLKVTLCHEGYLTPKSQGKHCMGATFKRHNVDHSFSQHEQYENKQKLAKCLHNKAWTNEVDINHQDANAAIRCTTRDHFPYVGALANYESTQAHYKNAEKSMPQDNAPFYDNVFILTGLGSRGLCSAPLLAELLCSQIEQAPLPFSKSILNAMQTNRQWVNYLKKGKKLKI